MLLSFLQPCWLTPWNLVTKMLAKQLKEPLALAVRRDATVAELQSMIESLTGLRCASQRLYGPARPADRSGRAGSAAAAAAAAGMRLLPTADRAAQGAALWDCGFWEKEPQAQQQQEPVVVWVAPVPGVFPLSLTHSLSRVATFRDERIVLRRPWYAELGDVVPDGIGCRDTNGSVECSMYCIYESTVDEAHDSVA